MSEQNENTPERIRPDADKERKLVDTVFGYAPTHREFSDVYFGTAIYDDLTDAIDTAGPLVALRAVENWLAARLDNFSDGAEHTPLMLRRWEVATKMVGDCADVLRLLCGKLEPPQFDDKQIEAVYPGGVE
jgi:hypothetical protein